MAEFLHGDALSRKIKEVVAGDNLFCAVAFWGDGAVKELFGKPRLMRKDVQIVCDLSMGATSPRTLKKLGAPNNQNLRHYPGLHAKVYRSDVGMVVGSANASNNGIGFMGEGAGLLESGVFLKPKSATWNQALEWFEEVLSPRKTKQIDIDALELCRTRWCARKRAAKRENPPQRKNKPSFLKALRDDPWLFGDICFVITDHSFSKAEQRDHIDAALEEEPEQVGLQDRVHFSAFGTKKTADWPLRFINLHIPKDHLGVHFRTSGDMIDEIHFARRSAISSPHFNDIYVHMKKALDHNVLAQCLNRLKEIRDDDDARIWTAKDLSERLFGSRHS